MYKKNKKQNYASFTLIEMMIVMAVTVIIFAATSSILTSMMKASNTVTSRVVVREEGEYLSEIIRKHVRNASYDVIRVYNRPNSRIRFDFDNPNVNYAYVKSLLGTPSLVDPTTGGQGTEIHFRPSDNPREMVCIGFFGDEWSTGRGYIIRSKVDLPGDFTLSTYNPNTCFPPNNTSHSQDFRNNFMVLNSDLVNIENLRISLAPGGLNNYYTFEITIEPQLGLGGFSRYNENSFPDYVKTFVVQTRAYRSW